MIDHDTFLQAIIEAPDDDTPRLIYADWLEERGDPRGEFIRVQCALTNLNETDERWSPQKHRERQLLAQYGTEWAGMLTGLVEEYEFRRGFVEYVSMAAPTFLQ